MDNVHTEREDRVVGEQLLLKGNKMPDHGPITASRFDGVPSQIIVTR